MKIVVQYCKIKPKIFKIPISLIYRQIKPKKKKL